MMGLNERQKVDMVKFQSAASELYTVKKLSTYAIAERFGCSQGKVARALKSAGVTMRTPAESKVLSF